MRVIKIILIIEHKKLPFNEVCWVLINLSLPKTLYLSKSKDITYAYKLLNYQGRSTRDYDQPLYKGSTFVINAV